MKTLDSQFAKIFLFPSWRIPHENISDGRIQDTTGEVIYKVRFQALVFKPIKGSIIEGIVKQVTNDGITIETGPLTAMLSYKVS